MAKNYKQKNGVGSKGTYCNVTRSCFHMRELGFVNLEYPMNKRSGNEQFLLYFQGALSHMHVLV